MNKLNTPTQSILSINKLDILEKTLHEKCRNYVPVIRMYNSIIENYKDIKVVCAHLEMLLDNYIRDGTGYDSAYELIDAEYYENNKYYYNLAIAAMESISIAINAQ